MKFKNVTKAHLKAVIEQAIELELNVNTYDVDLSKATKDQLILIAFLNELV